MDNKFQDKSDRFLDWFKSLPGATFHPNITIQDLRSRPAGRGIVAVSNIPTGTTLFTIPRSAIINTATCQLSSLVPSVFAESQHLGKDASSDIDEDAGLEPPDQWLSLILVMIYEHLHGRQSPWSPYMDVLPVSFETLMFWSADELSQLQASHVVDKIGKDQADDMFRSKVVPIVRKYGAVFYPDGMATLDDDELIALAHRMGSTIMAYAFDLENEEDEPMDEDDGWVEDREGQVMMGMVPMADILNADAEFNAHVNHEENSLTVTSLRPIAAGEEILNYYGPHPNSDLLRRYGYVTPKHSRYDVVGLSWEGALEITKQVLGVGDDIMDKAVNTLDPEEMEDMFVLERDCDPPDSSGQFSRDPAPPGVPSDLEDQLKVLLKEISKTNPHLLLDRTKRKEVILAVVSRLLQATLSQYPTTVEEDRQLIKTPGLSNRIKMAIFVRIGEKMLLREALDNVRRDEISMDMEDSGGGPPRKKARTIG